MSKKHIFNIVGITFLLCLIYILYINPFFLFGHRPYLTTCNNFISINDLEDWKIKNKNILKNINEYSVFIDFDYGTCLDKVGVIFNYDSYNTKNSIIDLIGSYVYIDGVPFKMYNR